jgi:Trk-type K+ transport system membrane component
MSFLANSSPLIFVWILILLTYAIFSILSSKKLISNKYVRKVAKKIRKYRLKYHIIHDAFWFTYMYAMYFAIYQFRVGKLDNSTNIINLLFAVAIFVIYFSFMCYMIYLGNKFKNP